MGRGLGGLGVSGNARHHRSVVLSVTMRVGIIGLGKLGTAIGRLVLEADHDLWVADKSDAPMVDLVVSSVLPGATLVEVESLVDAVDVTIVAIPQSAWADLPVEQMGSAILVDATNAWVYRWRLCPVACDR